MAAFTRIAFQASWRVRAQRRNPRARKRKSGFGARRLSGPVPGGASVPEIVRPPEGNPRFPLFDGLRAIAALSVLAYHVTGLWPDNEHTWFGAVSARLEFGVTIFFVLSGFLIYRPFVSARLNGTPRPALPTYLRRRALRILPAYWVALTVLAIYPGLSAVFSGHWWVYYGLLQVYHHEWYSLFQGLAVAWSLCIEVSFYLMLPLLAAGIARWTRGDAGKRVRTEILAIGGLALASLAFRVWIASPAPGAAGALTLPGTFDWFALGMILAVISADPRGTVRRLAPIRVLILRPAASWGIALVLFLLASRVGHYVPSADTATESLVRHVLYGLIALFLVLPAAFVGQGARGPVGILGNRTLVNFGMISYGLYLYHLPIIFELRNHGLSSPIPLGLAALAIATACATASYLLMERPLLRLKHTGPRPRRPAIGSFRGRLGPQPKVVALRHEPAAVEKPIEGA